MTARPTTSSDYGGHTFQCRKLSNNAVLLSDLDSPCDGSFKQHPISAIRFDTNGRIIFILTIQFIPISDLPSTLDVALYVNLKTYNLATMFSIAYYAGGNYIKTATTVVLLILIILILVS